MPTSATALAYAAPAPPLPARTMPLIQALKEWWESESADWDALVAGSVPATDPAVDLWDDMPVVDSKAVARTSPLFEQHLGLPLDVKLIRAGGYKSIDEMIDHLVPLMDEAAQKKQLGSAKQEAQ